jgi:hypothetical protein
MYNPVFRNIPILGGHISKLGQVQDLVYSSCSPTASLWVQGFFHAVPMLLWAINKPEPIDIDMVRRGRSHKRKRRFKLSITQIMQPTLTIRGLPATVRFAFNTYEQIGWYLLLADATTDFLVNWTSMTYRWAGCKVPEQPFAICRQNTIVVPSGEPSWLNYNNNSGNNKGIHAGLNGLTISENITASIQVEVYPNRFWDENGFRINSYTLELVKMVPFTILKTVHVERDPDGWLNPASFFMKDFLIGSMQGDYRLRITPNGAANVCVFDCGEFSAFGQDTRGLEPDP